MRLENKVNDNVKIGETNSKQATISAHKISKLQYILTKGLYSDPITAVIAEITNNGIDSVVQAGKDPKQHPVLVEIDRNEQGNYFFRVTDKGTGLDRNDFENILMNYLESTKEDSDETIGCYGLGSKSFLALDRAATFTCRKNGKEYKYLAYQGSQFCEYDLLCESDTLEENGVTFEISISMWEKSTFESKAKQKLAYYDTVALMIDKKLIENKIIRSADWQYSTESKDQHMHICLKDVYYKVDFSKLGIQSIDIPIGLKFGLKDGIAVTPSRESIIYTEKVKTIITNKIAAVAEWFVDKFNDTAKDAFDSIISVWDSLGNNNKYLNVGPLHLHMNPLLAYSEIAPLDIAVKGISVRNPFWYKINKSLLFGEYKTVTVKKNGGKLKSDNKSVRNIDLINSVVNSTHKVLLIDSIPFGYLRIYLEQKYSPDNCIFITKWSKRKLKSKFGQLSYFDDLQLTGIKRGNWRGAIQEFERVKEEFVSKVVDIRQIEQTSDFQNWLVSHKQFVKNNRKNGGSSNHKTLNKQLGDVTISIARDSKLGNDAVLEKKVFKINELYKEGKLFIVFKDSSEIIKYWEVIRKSNILACLIGSREITKISLDNIKNFIKFEEFMTRDCKPFMRIASSILYSKVIDEFEEVVRGRRDIFEKCLSSYSNDCATLKKFVNDNFADGAEENIIKAVIAVAEEHDLFDKQHWDIYIRLKNAIKSFEFLSCLKSPAYWDDIAVKKYNRLITQMLLFQKKYYDLEGYELVKKSDTASPTRLLVDDEELTEQLVKEEEEELELA